MGEEEKNGAFYLKKNSVLVLVNVALCAGLGGCFQCQIKPDKKRRGVVCAEK
jgi:hypothetical protein